MNVQTAARHAATVAQVEETCLAHDRAERRAAARSDARRVAALHHQMVQERIARRLRANARRDAESGEAGPSRRNDGDGNGEGQA